MGRISVSTVVGDSPRFWAVHGLEFLGGAPIRQEVLRRIGASRAFDGCRSELGPG